MELLLIFKALSNETRLKILQWLREPEVNFITDEPNQSFELGVPVSLIQKKSGLSQSTTSHYLSLLQQAKLVSVHRHGQWTYYKRNETAIEKLVGFLQRRL
jgi:DNA-binding transcriptional ArsR family regulator